MRRHRHPKTRSGDGQPRTEPAPTGISYLDALSDGHDETLKDQVSYRSLLGRPQQEQEEDSNGKDDGQDKEDGHE